MCQTIADGGKRCEYTIIGLALKPAGQKHITALATRFQESETKITRLLETALKDEHEKHPNLPPKATLARAVTRTEGQLASRPRQTSNMETQVNHIAGFRGVTQIEVEQKLQQYVEEYNKTGVTTYPKQTPKWLQGFTTKDFASKEFRRNPAFMWAVHRALTDPEAFPAPPEESTYVSVDLETAGPDDDPFTPSAGKIIEVGIVTYNNKGEELSRYQQLVNPGENFLNEHGTGAEHIHHISREMLTDAPTWETIAPLVAEKLNEGTFLAQNANFEHKWFEEHFAQAGISYEPSRPTADTMRISQQFYPDSENAKLGTICKRFNIPYGDGAHRAAFDAAVTGEAFFAMRDAITNHHNPTEA
jgi:DNA polymerase III epsilon subunit-like protein